MGAFILPLYIAGLLLLGIFSYGFIDPNLTLSTNQLFTDLSTPLRNLVYTARPESTFIFLGFLLLLFGCYLYFLKFHPKMWVVAAAACILAFSYPALTYDLFNYIATAKVTYLYRENPYLVMPTEIPSDPNLAFTRAANKVALYGPVWILFTAVPHYLGRGDIWQTIIAFKVMNALVYLSFSYFIYRVTRNATNVIFFALNPLVLIEVIMNGHNDLYMMFLALGSLVLWQRKKIQNKIAAAIVFFMSLWVKGATLALAPLFVLKNISFERLLVYAYILLSLVFFVVAPIREELYPWYAVWLVSVAALLPLKSHRFVTGFTIVLSFALELRALPYMWMGYYEGPGPMLRLLLTSLPIAIYILYFVLNQKHKRIV